MDSELVIMFSGNTICLHPDTEREMASIIEEINSAIKDSDLGRFRTIYFQNTFFSSKWLIGWYKRKRSEDPVEVQRLQTKLLKRAVRDREQAEDWRGGDDDE